MSSKPEEREIDAGEVAVGAALPNLTAWLGDWLEAPTPPSIVARRQPGGRVEVLAGVDGLATMCRGEGETVAAALAALEANMGEPEQEMER